MRYYHYYRLLLNLEKLLSYEVITLYFLIVTWPARCTALRAALVAAVFKSKTEKGSITSCPNKIQRLFSTIIIYHHNDN
jgi:hypothetical protein